MPEMSNIPQRLRLISGLTMFTFVTTHLINHALGLISLDAMQAAQRVFLAFWAHDIGAALLAAAFVTHLTLVGWKQVQRRTWRMPAVEAVRIVLGLLVLLLLTAHVLGNYVLFRVPDLAPTYGRFLAAFTPDKMIRQTLLVIAAWGHGCIGIHRWLRLRHGYRRLLPVLYPAAVLLPTLALLGVFEAYAEVQRVLADPAARTALQAATPKPNPELLAWALPWWKTAGRVTGGAIALVIVLNLAQRLWTRRRHGTVRIRYPSGHAVTVIAGTTVLEASQIAGIPHASVCGGRGRCSTCRVQIQTGLRELPEPSSHEAQVLKWIRAPQGVRLACQLRPAEDVSVVPLVAPNAGPEHARPQGRFLFGNELQIAVMFTDVRGFTRLSEQKLPYDIVHVLNQYFETMSEAIEANGGYLDKFIGDGIMALFGLEGGPAAGCRAALATAKEMAGRLDELNWRLAQDLPEPLRIGIGIHVGTAIVGEMGHKAASAVTAIGDTVNVASRLEGLTKKVNCQLVMAADVVRLAGISLAGTPRYKVTVRGRKEPLAIYTLPSAAHLPELAVPAKAAPLAARTAAPERRGVA